MIECAFTGRLGKDAELRMVKGGTMPMISFSAAVEEKVQGDDTPATWVRVVAFNGLAEQMAERLVKGTRCYVEGRLTAELWQPDDGRQARVNLQVVANVLQPIGQIGRQRPRQTRNGERGQRTWDRSRDAGRAQQAQAPFRDDWREAVADLEGRGR
jgi:single-strand DNA-binding protein